MSYLNNTGNTSLCAKEVEDTDYGNEATRQELQGEPIGDSFPVTMLLRAWQDGKEDAEERLFPMLYGELKKIAGTYLDREFGAQSMQTTELVNEAFLRLVSQKKVRWDDRTHFFGFAARIMRQLLIEYARKRKALKRGQDDATLPENAVDSVSPDLVRLDEALNELEKVDSRKCRVVELRYFAGLTNEEIAKVIGISVSSIKREWTLAKTWLYKYMLGN